MIEHVFLVSKVLFCHVLIRRDAQVPRTTDKLLEICDAWVGVLHIHKRSIDFSYLKTPWHGLPFIRSMVKPLLERLFFELSVLHQSFCETCFAASIR